MSTDVQCRYQNATGGSSHIAPLLFSKMSDKTTETLEKYKIDMYPPEIFENSCIVNIFLKLRESGQIQKIPQIQWANPETGKIVRLPSQQTSSVPVQLGNFMLQGTSITCIIY